MPYYVTSKGVAYHCSEARPLENHDSHTMHCPVCKSYIVEKELVEHAIKWEKDERARRAKNKH